SLKNPCFRQLNPPPATVKMALAQARHAAGSRPLTAVIFIATKTRSMPDDLAAQIAREMMPDCQPVIVMPSGLDSKAFLRKHNLQKTALDMSPVSNDFAHYIAILAGMDAIVSVDTSAVHIGAALRKPTIGIFSSIDHRLRVRYSSTVHPIQLCYSGRECHAPCGLSKNRYHFQTMLTNGRQIYWDFGYSCDEAFDRQEMTAWLDGKLQRLDLQGDTERQLQDIRRAASECFTKEPAPCWKTLNVPEIIKMLNGMIVQNDGE
ncbi:hypothetical protein KAR10_04005, partial [bacterium]|nr:hypothetical protein [bacterium]